MGYEVASPDSVRGGAEFTSTILNGIRQADLIVADVSRQNPNVLYELGFAHALRTPTILLHEIKSQSNLPSDLTGFEYIFYDSADLNTLAENIKSQLSEMTMRQRA